MNSQKLKSDIKLYLSRFETLVRISTLNNEYDINNHSENFLIPFLKKVFGWNLINANIIDKNAESIDLIDIKKRIAIQVSSNNKLEKIKDTLQKFFNSKYKNQVDEVYFYFLLHKQKSYSNRILNSTVKGKINFNVKTHVLDNETIYSIIKQITSLKKIKEIETYLKNEFSDFKIEEDVSIDDFENFKSQYKEACLNNFTRLNFFGLSIPNKPREIQLYSLFVKPDLSAGEVRYIINEESVESKMQYFTSIPVHINEPFHELETSSIITYSNPELFKTISTKYYAPQEFDRTKFHDLFKYGPHIVLLGEPGAGKSSLVKYSICKIVEEDFQVFKTKEVYSYLPYRVELHKYNQFKKEDKGGFLEFIKFNLINEFQIEIKASVLNKIVEKFPSLIFFDGLDEIFDIQERLQVRNDIENFIKSNKLVRSIVTSRYESYEEVKLSSKYYNIVHVKNFNDEQIKEYVEKWYSIEEENEKLRNNEIKDCIAQLKNVDNQLKHNPLLLSLILILYRNEQDLPTSKLEIYEGCSQTLVETRDKKEKKLALNLKIPHKISVFSNLAFWQFNNEINNNDFKIDYKSIKTFITQYLLGKGEFDDINEADEAAIQFLEYAKLRSIYFENKFTHKTFYEYFTSHYIFSNYYSTPGEYEKFLELLLTNIGLSAWAVILELLICQVDGSHLEYKVMDNIIDYLLNKKPYESCNLFAGVMPYLRTLSPTKAKLLILSMLNYIISKKNNTSNRYILKNKLLDLIRTKRFENIFYQELELQLNTDQEKNKEIFDFVYELNTSIKSTTLESLIANNQKFLEFDKPKYYIISHFAEIHNGKAFEIFNSFLNAFGKEACEKNYTSNYDISCFGKINSFNWIFYLLTQVKNKTELSNLELNMESVGFDENKIKDVILKNIDSFKAHTYLVTSYPVAYGKYFDMIRKREKKTNILIKKNSA